MSHTALPPHKVRALISLYHQSQDFITEENLDAAIDKAFIDDRTVRDSNLSPEEAYTDLRSKLFRRLGTSKVGQSTYVEPIRDGPEKQIWSETLAPREKAVISALFGVEGSAKPQLETLEDEGERIEKTLRRL